jgi:hypothetical protein
VSDCSTLPCTNTITVSNFEYNGAEQIQVEIGAMSPASSGLMDSFYAYLYASQDGTNMLIESIDSGLEKTISTVSFPFDTWMVWNAKSLYENFVNIGGTGELILRMNSTVAIPPSSGKIQVTLPEYKVSSGQLLCNIGYGALYTNIHPVWSEHWDRSQIRASDCLWNSTNSTLTVMLPDTIPKLWSGLGTGCTFINVTTTGATGINGIQTPATAGWKSLQVSTFDSGTKLESHYPLMYVNPLGMPSSYLVETAVKNPNAETYLTFNFTPSVKLLQAYDAFESGVFQNQSYILIEFSTLNAYESDLGLGFDSTTGFKTGDQVPCVALAGFEPLSTQLSCLFTRGDSDASTPLPATVKIAGYKTVKENTPLSVRLQKIYTPHLPNDNGNTKQWAEIRTSVYSLATDGTVTGIYTPTKYSPPEQSAGTSSVLSSELSNVKCAIGVSADNVAKMSSKLVDAVGTLSLPFQSEEGLVAGNTLYFSFPKAYYTLSSSIKLTIVTYEDSKTVTTLTPTVSADAGVITAILPKDFTLTFCTEYTLQLSNIRNPPFYGSCSGAGCKIDYYGIRDQNIKDSRSVGTTNGFWVDLGIKPSEVSSFTAEAAVKKANAINIKYTVSMSMQPRIPAGSVLSVTFPSAFPLLGNSNPSPLCSLNLSAASCRIASYSVYVTFSAAQDSATALTITLTGIRNPPVAGKVSGFVVDARDSAGRYIIQQSQTTTIEYTASDPVAAATFTFVPDLTTSGYPAYYTLAISAGTTVYKGTYFTLQLPSAFTMPADITCTLISGLLSYRQCSRSLNNAITLVTNEDAGGSISVGIQGIMNPTMTRVNNTEVFGPLSLTVVYDSVLLAQGGGVTVSITAPAAQLRIDSVSVNPLNGGEIGTYDLTIRAPVQFLTNSPLAVSIRFPSEFTPSLAPVGMNMACSSQPAAQTCGYYGPYEVRFSILESFSEFNNQLHFRMYGIANPAQGSTGNLMISFINTDTKTVLAMTDTGGSLTFLAPSQPLGIKALSADQLFAGMITTYHFTLDSGLSVLAENGALWIDWPSDYAGLFTSNSNTECLITYIGSSTMCTWLPETGYMRTQLLMPQPDAYNLFNSLKSIIFYVTIKGVTNPRSAGLTQPFSFRYVDLDAKVVRSSTFGSLIVVSRLEFTQPPSTIKRSADSVTVVQGTFSQTLTLTLGTPTYSPVSVRLSTTTQGIILDPPALDFRYQWNTVQNFRIGVLPNVLPGSYTIHFTKFEVSDAQSYGPMNDLTLTVSKSAGTVPIVFDAIPAIAVGETSVPLGVTLGAAPVYPFTLELVEVQTATNSTVVVNFDPEVLTFEQGQLTNNFAVNVTSGSGSMALTAILHGLGAAPYSISGTPSVTVGTQSSTQTSQIGTPSVVTTRTTATITFAFSYMATVSYVFSTQGTAAPTSAELARHIPTNDGAEHIFGTVWTSTKANSTNSYEAVLYVQGLTDATDYVVHFAYHGTTDKNLGSVASISFTTQASYKPAAFWVATTVKTDPEFVRLGLCKALALPCDLFQYRSSDPNSLAQQNTTAPTCGTEGSVASQFILVANRSQELSAEFDSPMQQVQLIKQGTLSTLIPNFCSAVDQTPSEYSFTAPKITSVALALYSENTVSVKVETSTPGKVAAVLLRSFEAAPSVAQILHGLNAANSKVPEGHFQSRGINSNVVLKFSNLENRFNYTVHVAGENDFPTYPVPTAAADVTSLPLTMGRAYTDFVASLESAVQLALALLYLVL